ncbi:MAG: hypothetical protein E7234_11135 [Lachnospiraceae bacterium]|jgi:phi13 family phage major tail protein|nr:hypothetical protein [Lachnospiraceae bacterium]
MIYMAANKKLALQGFSRLKLFPVIKNSSEGYEVGEGFDLPEAQEMTKETDASETKIYADDRLYLNMKSWNGLKVTITVAEMDLELMAKLGFGEIDPETKALKWNPQGKNNEYALSFRCATASGDYRMYKMFSFTVSEINETGVKTKGDGSEINAYQIVGTFTKRAMDGSPGEIKDTESAADLVWLDTIETLPETP